MRYISQVLIFVNISSRSDITIELLYKPTLLSPSPGDNSDYGVFQPGDIANEATHVINLPSVFSRLYIFFLSDEHNDCPYEI